MKKLLLVLVLSVVSVGLKADWLSDLNSVVKSTGLENLGNQISNEVKKYAPEVVSTGQKLLNNIPAEQRQALINQGETVVSKAAAIAQAQMDNNPKAVKAAQNLLKQHSNKLDTIQKQAIQAAGNNPAAVAAVKRYTEQAKMAAERAKNQYR